MFTLDAGFPQPELKFALDAGFPMLSDPVHLEGVAGGADLAAYLAHEATCCHVLRLHVSCHATRSNSVSLVLDVFALKHYRVLLPRKTLGGK
jgi:hypothetical protein